MSIMFAASMRKSSSSTIVSANSSTSAGGLASEAIGIRPTRNGAIQLITRRSLCTRRGRPRPLHLDDDLLAGAQRGGVHLGDRGGGERGGVERGEQVLDPAAEVGLDHRADGVERLGRHLVAAQLELADQLLGEQALAAGDDLAELDVRRTEVLGGVAQPAGDVGPAGLRRGEAVAPAPRPPRPEGGAQRADHGGDAQARGDLRLLGQIGHLGPGRGSQLGGQRQPADLVPFQRPRTVVAERRPVGVGRASHPGMIAGASTDRNSPGSAIRAGPAGTLGRCVGWPPSPSVAWSRPDAAARRDRMPP